MKIVCVNSMEKIFPDIEPSLTLRRASVFGNERYNFQFAVCSEKDVAATFSLSVNGREIPAKLVKSMPSQLSKYLNVSDDFVIFKERASTFPWVGCVHECISPQGKIIFPFRFAKKGKIHTPPDLSSMYCPQIFRNAIFRTRRGFITIVFPITIGKRSFRLAITRSCGGILKT